ncbi:hypothetical protein AYI70_g1531 [Smittium culicis]|uniref:Uncharacterized protein n=1 Tax=Smittium culicis TaxID=133412 RepID=A0A1R1YC92_9FUNG|nr:hypothetical protein AYI70_g1531 [Smittium culicis]
MFLKLLSELIAADLKDNSEQLWDKLKSVTIESVVRIQGLVVSRASKNSASDKIDQNLDLNAPKSLPKEASFEILCKDLEILNLAQPLPFLPSSKKNLVNFYSNELQLYLEQ